MMSKNVKKYMIPDKQKLEIARVHQYINLFHNYPEHHGVSEFVSLLTRLHTNKGHKKAMDLLKSYKLHLQQVGLCQTVTEIPFHKLDKDGFPLVLKPWKITTNSQDDKLRYVYSVWRLLDILTVKSEYDVSTITNECTANMDVISDITQFMKSWKVLKGLGDAPDRGRMLLSNKAGPNGPATMTSLVDLGVLKKDPILYKAISSLISKTIIGMRLDDFKPEPGGVTHSKLVLLDDKAYKVRQVAIADYWSNVSLSGIHAKCMHLLSTLSVDVTYRQDKIPKLLRALGPNLYSSDLSAFTDRFPIKLETAMLAIAWPEIGPLWEQVVSKRSFTHPKGNVEYSTGNPMGLLSSWPVSTLCHHAVKHYCAYKILGRGALKYRYLILGDDTCDSNEDVYKFYKQTISSLGVSISTRKCTTSQKSNVEFAKRLFKSHTEVTGLPVDLMVDIDKFPEQILELLRIAVSRGYEPSYLSPGLLVVVEKHKNAKQLRDILSLPVIVTGMPPILEGKPDSYGAKLSLLQDSEILHLLQIARDVEFHRIVTEHASKRESALANHTANEKVIDKNHPLRLGIDAKCCQYLIHGGEFSIYDEWMKGNYRELAHVPNEETYSTKNKGHYVTRCQYRVYVNLLELVGGNCNINLVPFRCVSNLELFMRGFNIKTQKEMEKLNLLLNI